MASAAVPEEIWTGVPPAKSRPPRTKDQPFAFQVQFAIGSYTRVDQTKMKIIIGPSLPRSAMAPTASIGLGRGVRDNPRGYRRKGFRGLLT